MILQLQGKGIQKYSIYVTIESPVFLCASYPQERWVEKDINVIPKTAHLLYLASDKLTYLHFLMQI